LQPARPRPAPAASCDQALDVLADPALTGTSRPDFDALAAALDLPFAAAREQRLHLARGGPRRNSTGQGAPVKLSLAACLLAALYRYRLGMTCQLIADLLGAGHSTVSVATRHIADLLSRSGTAITPGPHRLRTLDDLHRHAAAAGITIPGPPAAANGR
jgi:hypothetical protein